MSGTFGLESSAVCVTTACASLRYFVRRANRRPELSPSRRSPGSMPKRASGSPARRPIGCNSVNQVSRSDQDRRLSRTMYPAHMSPASKASTRIRRTKPASRCRCGRGTLGNPISRLFQQAVPASALPGRRRSPPRHGPAHRATEEGGSHRPRRSKTSGTYREIPGPCV